MTTLERTAYDEVILPEYIEDLGGVTVELRNAVHVRVDKATGEEEVMIPDMRRLVRTAALARALIPVHLRAADIKFMRRALDMKQAEFAEAMELSAETVSRWENGVRGVGGLAEKTLRHNLCALLREQVSGVDYDPAVITRMRIVDCADDEELPPIPIERVRIKTNGVREDTWDMAA